MHSKWVFKHFSPQTGKRIFSLVLIWGIGLLLGALLCNLVPYDCTDVLYSAVYTKPSPLILLLVCVLPVILSATVAYSPLFPIAFIFVFLSAVSHGFCGMAVNAVFGSSAWIVRLLLLFSSGCTSVLMWWLLLQSNTGRNVKKHIRFALVMSCLVYIFDLFLVSPFVGDLIKVL